MTETREVTEYKVFVLCVADMHGGVDKSQPVAVFDELEKLKAYYQKNLADAPYTDAPSEDNFGQSHSWNKVFKKGSALEWYNPASSLEPASFSDVAFGGVVEDWVRTLGNFVVPFNPE